jgi:hypothetical protein
VLEWVSDQAADQALATDNRVEDRSLREVFGVSD